MFHSARHFRFGDSSALDGAAASADYTDASKRDRREVRRNDVTDDDAAGGLGVPGDGDRRPAPDPFAEDGAENRRPGGDRTYAFDRTPVRLPGLHAGDRHGDGSLVGGFRAEVSVLDPFVAQDGDDLRVRDRLPVRSSGSGVRHRVRRRRTGGNPDARLPVRNPHPGYPLLRRTAFPSASVASARPRERISRRRFSRG